ncbi:hypothetical protein [Flavobacterium covae]
MKPLIKIVLLFLFLFQFTPSVISLVDREKGAKLSLVLLEEEEEESTKESKETKEIKEIKTEFISFFIDYQITSNFTDLQKVVDMYLLLDYTTEFTLQILPPEWI